MTTGRTRTYSDLPIPPGEYLAEELEVRGMPRQELAARLDRSPQFANEIINAKQSITPETALGLEKALGIHAEFWTNLESAYQTTLSLGVTSVG